MGLWGNNVYVNTPQGHLYALDARTGKEVWKTHITDEKTSQQARLIGGSTGGVIIIKGRVLVGMTNCGRKGDDNHCYISAYDANTGKRDWKFVTVALKGQPGGDTWGGLPDNDAQGRRDLDRRHLRSRAEHDLLGHGPGQAVAARPARHRATAPPTMPTPPWRWIPTPAS